MAILAVLWEGGCLSRSRGMLENSWNSCSLGGEEGGKVLSQLALPSCFSCLHQLGLLGTQPRLVLYIGANPERARWKRISAEPRRRLGGNFVSVCCSVPPKPTSSGFPAGHRWLHQADKYNKPGLVLLASGWACVHITEPLLHLIPKQGDLF